MFMFIPPRKTNKKNSTEIFLSQPHLHESATNVTQGNRISEHTDMV